MKNELDSRPLILISNDDGYQAKGINFLTDIARRYGDVIVCAPDGARSGYSMIVSFTKPLTTSVIREEEATDSLGSLKVISCSGTPCDCTKMGVHKFCPRKPDLVLGGINHGDNSSVNAHYSGTVAVAMEGCMKRIPSVAFSICDHNPDADFEPMRIYINKVLEMVLRNGLPDGVCLNVNAPMLPEYKGIRVCQMADGSWGKEIEECDHPRGYKYYWVVGKYECLDDRRSSDQRSLEDGYVTVTPVQVDVTAYGYIDELRLMVEKF